MKAGWQRKSLGSILSILNGYAFDAKAFTAEAGTPLIRIRDLKNGVTTQTNFEGPFDQRYVVKAGNFLIGMDGEFGCFEWRGPDALLNQRVCKLHSFTADIDPKFLFYGINKHLKEIEDNTTFTTVKHLSSKQIANIEFAFPSLDEQRRLVAVLDKAFAGIATATANAQKNLTNARALFESRLNDIISEFGQKAEPKQLASYLELITYGFTNPMPTEHSGPYMVTAKNVVGGRIDFNNTRRTSQAAFDKLLTNKSRPAVGDVLLTKDGTLGRLAVVDQPNICINQSVALLRCNSLLEPKFLLDLLSSRDYQSEMIANAGGTTIKHIYITRVDKMLVRVPNLNDQQEANALIESLRNATARLISSATRKLVALTELKQSLLQKAFAGELT